MRVSGGWAHWHWRARQLAWLRQSTWLPGVLAQVETIGDCYVVAGGLIHEDAEGFAAVKGDGVDASQADKVFAFARASEFRASALA